MRIPSLATTLVAAITFPIAAQAQRTIRVPADAGTIQSAINTSTNGDTVLVSPGTYAVTITAIGTSNGTTVPHIVSFTLTVTPK